MNVPTKALIMNLDSGQRFECYFNPKEYTVAKQNHWASQQVPTTNMPQMVFGGGEPATMQMSLLFDTYAQSVGGGPPRDVRKAFTEPLCHMMLVDEKLRDPRNNRARPPIVRFVWGATWSFNAVITSISQRFTLFSADGTPVRALLDLAFQQVEDEALLPKQNPTSGGIASVRQWTVRDGDTLALIAFREYGDATRWRPIADANRLTRVRRLAPGTALVIPHD
jgi:nucleoid-associated protein YgaU